MTTLAGTPDLVAMVQTATYTPILLLALLAGTLADLWDRRRVLLLAQFWMVLISVGLAWLSGLDLVTPATLPIFTFLIGVGTALTGLAWQASVRGIVPQGELAAAVTLNAIAMNFARAVGPAVGGAVVAAAGGAPRSTSTLLARWCWPVRSSGGGMTCRATIFPASGSAAPS